MNSEENSHSETGTMYELTETPSVEGNLYGVVWKDDDQTLCYNAITDNKEELQALVLLCNQLQLDKCQLEDVLDDFLTDHRV